MSRLSGKLTAKTLGWDRNAIGMATSAVPAVGGRVLLGRIVGIVAGLKQIVNADTGEISNGLKGQFRGVSSKKDADGNEISVTAGVCYLPGGIQDMIEGALSAAQDTANGGNSRATVQFGIDLYAIPATNKAGYSFDADSLVSATEADPLAMLLDMAAGAPALDAPEAAPQLEGPETEAEPAKGTAKK